VAVLNINVVQARHCHLPQYPKAVLKVGLRDRIDPAALYLTVAVQHIARPFNMPRLADNHCGILAKRLQELDVGHLREKLSRHEPGLMRHQSGLDVDQQLLDLHQFDRHQRGDRQLLKPAPVLPVLVLCRQRTGREALQVLAILGQQSWWPRA
jgi:hypothetical protein